MNNSTYHGNGDAHTRVRTKMALIVVGVLAYITCALYCTIVLPDPLADRALASGISIGTDTVRAGSMHSAETMARLRSLMPDSQRNRLEFGFRFASMCLFFGVIPGALRFCLWVYAARQRILLKKSGDWTKSQEMAYQEALEAEAERNRELQRQQIQRAAEEAAEQARLAVTPFEHGGYDMTQHM